MRYVGCDTETAMIADDQPFPRLVTGSWYAFDGQAIDGRYGSSGILPAVEYAQLIYRLLCDPSVALVWHNAAFDLPVIVQALKRIGIDAIEPVFEAYESGRIVCTMVRELLIRLARDGITFDCGLAATLKRRCDIDISEDKKGGVRLTYGPLETVPIDRWSNEHKRYALFDAYYVYLVHRSQAEETRSRDWLGVERIETCAAFAYSLVSARGLRIDTARQGEMRTYCERALDRFRPDFEAIGLMQDGTVKQARLFELVSDAYAAAGKKPARTATKRPSTAAKKLRRLMAEANGVDHPSLDVLRQYLRFKKVQHTLSHYLSYSSRIHAGFRTILKNSRTSSTPNVQNPPRNGLDCMVCDLPASKRDAETHCPRCGWPVYDVRANYVASNGYCFLDGDYPTLEMRCLAEVQTQMFGSSCVADYLIRGVDVHLMVAAEWLGISYESALARFNAGDKLVKSRRQSSKPVNFGRPGGLGDVGMVEYAENFDIYMTLAESRESGAAWMRRYPDARRYFAETKKALRWHGGTIKHPITGLVRGDATFTTAANFWFSCLAQYGMKSVLWRLVRECYAPRGPMSGCYVVNVVHDQFITECPDDPDKRTGAARRKREIMTEGMAQWIRCVPVGEIEIVASSHWSKSATAKYDERGRLMLSG